ncbi:MAG TPA: hypothetical protein VGG03_05830 [Thermoanaerobaculia bacterium]
MLKLAELAIKEEVLGTIKDELRDLVENLPDDATWGEVMYAIYVRQKIAMGLKAADEDRVVPHEAVKQRFAPDPPCR